VSWLLPHDVEEARANYTVTAVISHAEGHEAAEEVHDGEMPPKVFLLDHPEARLTEDEKKAFAVGLDATFGRRHQRGGPEAGEVGEKSGYMD
jgi:hypothetical protein